MPTSTFFKLNKDKQARIVTAALHEFYEQGFEKASIARIVKAADVARGSFYQYFDGLKDVYRYLLIEIIGKEKHRSSTRFFTENASFVQIIGDLLHGGIDFYLAHPIMAKVAQDFAKIRDPRLKKEIMEERFDESAAYFHQLIDQKKAVGELDTKVDTETLHRFISSLTFSLSELLDGNPAMMQDKKALTELINHYLYLLENGFVAKKSSR